MGGHDVRINIYTCDVMDGGQVSQTVDTVVRELGQIDFLFNNAGYQGAFAPVQDYPDDDFARVMNINVCGAFHVLRYVAQHMITRKFGRIVNTASMAGVQGPPNMAGYAASKFAIVGLTEVAAKDLAPHNIRVNAISPASWGRVSCGTGRWNCRPGRQPVLFHRPQGSRTADDQQRSHAPLWQY